MSIANSERIFPYCDAALRNFECCEKFTLEFALQKFGFSCWRFLILGGNVVDGNFFACLPFQGRWLLGTKVLLYLITDVDGCSRCWSAMTNNVSTLNVLPVLDDFCEQRLLSPSPQACHKDRCHLVLWWGLDGSYTWIDAKRMNFSGSGRRRYQCFFAVLLACREAWCWSLTFL